MIKGNTTSDILLVVENNEENQRLATRILQKYGHSVEIVSVDLTSEPLTSYNNKQHLLFCTLIQTFRYGPWCRGLAVLLLYVDLKAAGRSIVYIDTPWADALLVSRHSQSAVARNYYCYM